MVARRVWLYHPSRKERIFEDAEIEQALAGEWVENPADLEIKVAPEPAKDNSREVEIEMAVGNLIGKKKKCTKDGKPKVREVEKILGYDIAETERDSAYERLTG